MVFSPKQQLKGRCILLTGALGFEGSIVLEQLLRLTEVKTVYILVRAKKNVPAAKRVQELLSSELFNQLHKEILSGKQNPFSRVHPIEGDLTKPGLGLCHQDLRLIRSNVILVLHCGALIELDADVHKTLRTNYVGTYELMKVASQMEQLRAFVHVSTYFVNNHLPRNSLVEERIYPLPLEINGEPCTHREYVSAMLSMDAASANQHTAELMQHLGFTSTYAFGKHLSEQLVDSTVIKPGVSRAIVRPSLIASIAQDPYPGYIKSYAGAAGYSMGYALCFFQGLRSVAYSSDTFLDLIPADTVAHLIIAAGAAAAATYGSPCADHAAVIFHAAASESNPLTISHAFDILSTFWKANPPPLTLPASRYPRMTSQHSPTAQGIAAGQSLSKMKLQVLGGMLKLAGKHKELQALKCGLKAFTVHNSLPYNKSIVCSVSNVRALHSQMATKEQDVWKVVFDSQKVLPVDIYCYTFLAGVRRLLMRMDGDIRRVQHNFTLRLLASPGDVHIIRAAAASTGAVVRSSAIGNLCPQHGHSRSRSSGSGGCSTNAGSSKLRMDTSTRVKPTLSAEDGDQDHDAAAAVTEAAATVAAAARVL